MTNLDSTSTVLSEISPCIIQLNYYIHDNNNKVYTTD